MICPKEVYHLIEEANDSYVKQLENKIWQYIIKYGFVLQQNISIVICPASEKTYVYDVKFCMVT